MTREEKEVALYCLKASSDYHSEVCEECIKYPNCDHTIQDDVTETIIKALEQEPCEDAVSRKDLYNALYEHFHDEDAPNNITEVRLGVVRNFVKDFPSVTPTRKKGKWIEHPHEAGENWEYSKYECSECHVWANDDSDFCPNCGTEMESE